MAKMSPLTKEQEAKIRQHSLDLKHDYQLEAMADSHALKLAELTKRGGDLEKVTQRPDAVRQELIEAFPAFTDTEIEEELLSQQAYYIWKRDILTEVVDIIDVERGARVGGVVSREPIGTEYFVDGDAGNNGNAGTSIGVPWLDIDQFTENARSAGDICTVRRGTTIDNGSDLNFTSDGTKVSPIIIRADNANAFNDDVDLSATATATLIFGSKTVTFSADISGVLAAGDWIYAAGDDADEFAYEVDSVATVTVTLFLPYKGAQAGSGKTMTNMQAAPIWNTAAGDFKWNFSNDEMWKIQGIHIRGTDISGNVDIDSSVWEVFKDCIFEGNGASDYGIRATDDGCTVYLSKCRFFNHVDNFESFAGAGDFLATLRDCLLDGNSVGGSSGIRIARWGNVTCIDSEFKNHANADIRADQALGVAQIFLRNCILSSATEIDLRFSVDGGGSSVFSEDHDGSPNVSAQYTPLGSGASTALIDSDTGTVRSGGGAISGKCTPSTNLGTKWELGRVLLFEIPFYATTDSKKYEIFFRPTATADWTNDPSASELWIEFEYWGHASNNFRRITKSVGVIDMNGSTAWTALDVTIAPSQIGVAYLRGYYAKTKEAGKANTFFWDIVPVVT